MNEIKRSKLEWASYVWRKSNSMIKIVILGNLKCKRPLGRPRLRWEECIRKNFSNTI